MLFQLRDHPAHEFKLDVRLERPSAAPEGTLNIVDLRMGDACGRLLNPVDTLMFHVPTTAIEDILQQAGAENIAPLRAPDPWLTVDPMVQQIAPLLKDGLSKGGNGQCQLFHEHKHGTLDIRDALTCNLEASIVAIAGSSGSIGIPQLKAHVRGPQGGGPGHFS